MPLHTLNRLRVKWIISHLQKSAVGHQQGRIPLAGLLFLDVGFGGGILSKSLARLGAKVVGVDVVEKISLLVARCKYRARYSEIKALLERDNFIVQHATGVAINPFNRTMKMTPVPGVNYMLFAKRQENKQ